MIEEEITKIDEKIHSKGNLYSAILQGVDWIQTTLEICQNHGFNEQDALEITREVGYLILGVSNIKRFIDEVKERTSLSESGARILFSDLGEHLFKKIENGYEIVEINISTEIKKIEEKERLYTETSHILIVPIKPKEGQSVEQREIEIPEKENIASEYVDPYKEILE